eukprot:gnl/TRDRNA2_/TRDRNA2_181784_c0_seq1.p1 gnl/TRDRNA2_/TRDRNA2_181784_c0~~gnl/TRDRNA2_/TRDRNA2_181784_c0_seq1.p1  ORF type:complete len:330 (+),score=92.76 gnl/TRDRNA2_/TRDRNA2_181784_c0_seq1:64-1053(+)
MANWVIALLICSVASTAGAACTGEGSTTCTANDEAALVQKDLTVVNAHKLEVAEPEKKLAEDEFEFMGVKHKLEGPFLYCKFAAYPVECAVAMAPQVLLPGGTLNPNRPWLKEDGSQMNETEKAETKYKMAVEDALAHNETPPTTTTATTTTTTLVPPKVQVADKKSWLQKNDWCPTTQGTCSMMVGLDREEESDLITRVVQETDAEAEAFYLSSLSKVQGEPTMGVIYPKEMKVDCCLMYQVLKSYDGVSYVDFDSKGIVAKYKKKESSLSSQKKSAETHKTAAKAPKSSPKPSPKPSDDDDSEEESAGSRMAVGMSALALAGLALRL